MAKTTTDADAPKSKKKLIVIIVLVLALAGGGFWFTQMRHTEEPHPEPGEVLTLEPVSVNLAGGGYLKIGIALQLTADAAGGHGGGPNGAKALDIVIAEFSQANPRDVTGEREKLKHALEEKIIEAYHHTVMGIYYTEYVSQ